VTVLAKPLPGSSAIAPDGARPRSRRPRRAASALLALVLAGCGGGNSAQPPPPARSSGAEPAPGRGGGLQVSGLLGTIPEREVHAALEPRLGSFQRCFVRGAEQVELLAGAMEFYFRVAADGAVEWVYPRSSSVGHRATEQCLLAAAASTRFPEPQGGDAAEFAWSFEIDLSEDVRPPVAWQASHVEAALAEQSASLDGCGLQGGALLVTAYVAPGGALLAVGASAASHEAAEQIDCALDAIRGWTLADPGSYAAKVSFPVP
jgi:hypothetical protein